MQAHALQRERHARRIGGGIDLAIGDRRRADPCEDHCIRDTDRQNRSLEGGGRADHTGCDLVGLGQRDLAFDMDEVFDDDRGTREEREARLVHVEDRISGGRVDVIAIRRSEQILAAEHGQAVAPFGREKIDRLPPIEHVDRAGRIIGLVHLERQRVEGDIHQINPGQRRRSDIGLERSEGAGIGERIGRLDRGEQDIGARDGDTGAVRDADEELGLVIRRGVAAIRGLVGGIDAQADPRQHRIIHIGGDVEGAVVVHIHIDDILRERKLRAHIDEAEGVERQVAHNLRAVCAGVEGDHLVIRAIGEGDRSRRIVRGVALRGRAVQIDRIPVEEGRGVVPGGLRRVVVEREGIDRQFHPLGQTGERAALDIAQHRRRRGRGGHGQRAVCGRGRLDQRKRDISGSHRQAHTARLADEEVLDMQADQHEACVLETVGGAVQLCLDLVAHHDVEGGRAGDEAEDIQIQAARDHQIRAVFGSDRIDAQILNDRCPVELITIGRVAPVQREVERVHRQLQPLRQTARRDRVGMGGHRGPAARDGARVCDQIDHLGHRDQVEGKPFGREARARIGDGVDPVEFVIGKLAARADEDIGAVDREGEGLGADRAALRIVDGEIADHTRQTARQQDRAFDLQFDIGAELDAEARVEIGDIGQRVDLIDAGRAPVELVTVRIRAVHREVEILHRRGQRQALQTQLIDAQRQRHPAAGHGGRGHGGGVFRHHHQFDRAALRHEAHALIGIDRAVVLEHTVDTGEEVQIAQGEDQNLRPGQRAIGVDCGGDRHIGEQALDREGAGGDHDARHVQLRHGAGHRQDRGRVIAIRAVGDRQAQIEALPVHHRVVGRVQRVGVAEVGFDRDIRDFQREARKAGHADALRGHEDCRPTFDRAGLDHTCRQRVVGGLGDRGELDAHVVRVDASTLGRAHIRDLAIGAGEDTALPREEIAAGQREGHHRRALDDQPVAVVERLGQDLARHGARDGDETIDGELDIAAEGDVEARAHLGHVEHIDRGEIADLGHAGRGPVDPLAIHRIRAVEAEIEIEALHRDRAGKALQAHCGYVERNGSPAARHCRKRHAQRIFLHQHQLQRGVLGHEAGALIGVDRAVAQKRTADTREEVQIRQSED